ncbi:restriction endonuclease subunit S [Capnocytophaga gingivalis]|uniref:Restriction endonuclease subunit S n=1 Tax=Capnocytophaga gingivalis TaxID=1017 RepID=A0A250FNY6_9FLAO|nr:restriction endonuclease subunit S [Capnocytophaga gingivalis]
MAFVCSHNTPYEKLPKGWAWCRLGDIANIQTGKKDANYGDKNGKYPFFTCALLPLRCNNYSFDMEAVLLPGNGANVGEVVYFKGKFEAYQRTYILNFNIGNIRFFYYVLKALWKKSLEGKQFGSATNYIRLSNIEELFFPLPPLAEQHRIVQQIENYFTVFNQVENELA